MKTIIKIFLIFFLALNAFAFDPNDPNTPPDPAFGNMPSQQKDAPLGEDHSTDPYYRPSSSSSSDGSSDSSSYKSSSPNSSSDSGDNKSSADQYQDTSVSKPLGSNQNSDDDK